MFAGSDTFSSFSIDDAAAAVAFYRDTLGLETSVNAMGFVDITLPDGHRVLAYVKSTHVPAEFTVLNFGVADVDATVDALNAKGVVTKLYQEFTDAKGVQRGHGPDIAWFADPAGNVLSVIGTWPPVKA